MISELFIYLTSLNHVKTAYASKWSNDPWTNWWNSWLPCGLSKFKWPHDDHGRPLPYRTSGLLVILGPLSCLISQPFLVSLTFWSTPKYGSWAVVNYWVGGFKLQWKHSFFHVMQVQDDCRFTLTLELNGLECFPSAFCLQIEKPPTTYSFWSCRKFSPKAVPIPSVAWAAAFGNGNLPTKSPSCVCLLSLLLVLGTIGGRWGTHLLSRLFFFLFRVSNRYS